jgi:DNA-binding GntR family transcriptional regulator
MSFYVSRLVSKTADMSPTSAIDEDPIQLIQMLAKTTCVACTEITASRLAALQESVRQAGSIPAKLEWDRKAAAHAEFFSLLAETADDPYVARVLVRGAGFAYDLMITVGRVADGVIENSRERLFTHLRADDAEAAALEMEECLRILYWLCRLGTSVADPAW